MVPKIEVNIPQIGVRGRWVQPRCRCEIEEHIEKPQREAAEKLRMDRIRQMFDIGDLGERFESCTFTEFIPRPGAVKALETARSYVREFDRWSSEGSGLYLWGAPGNGKTHIAGSIAHALTEAGTVVVFVKVPDLLDRIRRTFRDRSKESEEQIMRAITDCHLLVLDDLGSERVSDWVAEVMFKVIDARYVARRSVVITSNLMPPEIEKRFDDLQGKRIADRIFEMCVPVENTADSYRKEQAKKRRRDMEGKH